MARIELRHATVRMKSGFSGTGAVNDTPANGNTDLDIDTLVVNGVLGTDVIPVGARFTVVGSTNTYTVTARTPSDGSATTTNVAFTPALATADGIPGGTAVITFLPQQLEVTVGDGNLTFTENRTYEYELDRGDLDTVRETDQVPMDVTLDMVWEFLKTGTGESVTPYDALHQEGGAVEWPSSSDDSCEPFAIDIEVEYAPTCTAGAVEDEIYLFPDFRADTIEGDIREATISASGRCNATKPTITRS